MTTPTNSSGDAVSSPSGTDRILDHVDDALDPEKADKNTIEQFKSPFVRRAFSVLLAMMFLIFVTYFVSFIYQIPLPESEVLKKIIDSIIAIMKILVPDS